MTSTDTATSRIRRAVAGNADVIRVTGILADAFLHGDLAGWLVPDEDQRRSIYPPYFQMMAQHAIEHGHVEILGDDATAVWYDLGPEPTITIDNYDKRLAAITGGTLDRFQQLDAAMHTHHPRGTPHAYLAFLAVRQQRQGQGLGTMLLKHRHTDLDRERRPAYLEATGPRNSALYQNHGYEPLGSYPIAQQPPGTDPLTTGGAQLDPMWRPAAG
jgi:GNAT superfamily N-acetyltransferase